MSTPLCPNRLSPGRPARPHVCKRLGGGRTSRRAPVSRVEPYAACRQSDAMTGHVQAPRDWEHVTRKGAAVNPPTTRADNSACPLGATPQRTQREMGCSETVREDVQHWQGVQRGSSALCPGCFRGHADDAIQCIGAVKRSPLIPLGPVNPGIARAVKPASRWWPHPAWRHALPPAPAASAAKHQVGALNARGHAQCTHGGRP